MRPTRFTLAWSLVLGVIALVLCGVPLFDLLSFEFAFAMGIPLSIYGGTCGVRARRQLDGAFRAWADAARRVVVAALLPLAIITVNALRVPNCDYLEGLAFYGLITVVGGLVAAAWGAAIGRFAPRRGVLVFVAALVVTVLLGVARFIFEPPIDVFHALLGYWPGAVYDDVILIDDRLLWSRLEDGAWGLAWLALSDCRRPFARWPTTLAACALALAVGARIGATAHAVHRDAAWIAAELGGTTDTEHLRIHHPAAWSPERVEQIAWELEFAYAELKAFFGVDLSRRGTIWLYADDRSKKRLMGARRVRLAKPWQWSFHVHRPRVGQAVLIHELAHVFSAELADPPHRLSLYRGVVPHMPIIEGLAEAATWKTDRLDLHQWSKAMRAIDVAPALRAVLAPTGFYGRNSRTAYTLCGSFTRYYRDVEGPEALAEAYRTGTFEPPKGPNLDARIADWQTFVDGQPLDPRALAFAQARFDRPAIFGRACAHEIAALRSAAHRAPIEEALALTDEILGHLPGDLSARLNRATLLMRLDRPDEAHAAALELADDERAGAVMRARARERLADIEAADNRLDAARSRYDRALETAFVRGDIRRLRIKRMAVDGGEQGVMALRYLVDRPMMDDDAARAMLDAMVALDPTWAPGRYVRGRFRLGQKERVAGLADLTAAAPGLADPSLQIELNRLADRALFDARCYAEAASRFGRRVDDERLDPPERSNRARWSRRAAFFAQQAGASPPACTEIDIAAAALDDAAGIGHR